MKIALYSHRNRTATVKGKCHLMLLEPHLEGRDPVHLASSKGLSPCLAPADSQ